MSGPTCFYCGAPTRRASSARCERCALCAPERFTAPELDPAVVLEVDLDRRATAVTERELAEAAVDYRPADRRLPAVGLEVTELVGGLYPNGRRYVLGREDALDALDEVGRRCDHLGSCEFRLGRAAALQEVARWAGVGVRTRRPVDIRDRLELVLEQRATAVAYRRARSAYRSATPGLRP